MKLFKSFFALVSVLSLIIPTVMASSGPYDIQEGDMYGLIHSIPQTTDNPPDSIDWAGEPLGPHQSTHGFITDKAIAIMTRDLSYFPLSGYTATLRNASDWPDSNENENGLFIGHFYDPDTGKSIFQYTSPTARTRLVSWYNNAVSQYRAGNISMAMTYLGRALHYAEDLSTPHHAANLAAYASYHLEYEQWVQEHQTNYIELNAPAATYNWARRTSISDMGHNLSYSTIILIMGTLI